MKRRIWAPLTGAVMLAVAGSGVRAEIKDNPYQEIVSRNAFALKPIPEPPKPGENQPPPTAVDVYLTGISTLGGTRKVLLQIVDKGPGKKPELPPPLVEGDVQGRVEVVSIDPDKGAVLVKIDGTEKNLTFEKDSPKPGGGGAPPAGPGAPPAPGHPNPAGTVPLTGAATPAAAAAAIGAHGGAVASKTGVVVGGGTASMPAPAAAASAPGAVAAGAASGLASTLSRPVRTDGVLVGGSGSTAAAGGAATRASTTPAMTPQQVMALIEARRQAQADAINSGAMPRTRALPYPPTPLSPRTTPTPVPGTP